MTDREKLIAIIEKSLDDGFKKHIPLTSNFLADRLLENGIIVPPCKVGDQVYEIFRNRDLRQRNVVEILIGEDSSFVLGGDIYSEERYDFSSFGKTAFHSQREAIKALEALEEV